jgi:hypothetical protein
MYTGPEPNSINKLFPDHTYDLITCLINGEQKKIIQDRYLKKLGSSKETYLEIFPNAPLKSFGASESYRKASLTEEGRKRRSENITRLNLEDKKFQKSRYDSVCDFYRSDRSLELKKTLSEKAKLQHKTGLDDAVRYYFMTDYKGSSVQKEKSERFKNDNPSFRPEVLEKSKQTYIRNSELGLHNKETKYKKKKYKDTDLIYQSSYELDFLEYCEKNNILDKIKNSPCFSSVDYPYNFYAPDYIFDNQYVIEIKSWYIENLQEKRYPGILEVKKKLIESEGYKFLYIRDKNYISACETLMCHPENFSLSIDKKCC